MEQEVNKKMGFFTKLKTAIFKLEEYDRFLGQKFSEAFKYFILVILIITTAFAIAYSYENSKQINKAISYIKNEMPDFSLENGILKSSNNVEAYDEEYKFRLFINTDDNVSEEVLNGYKEKIFAESFGAIILKDKVKVYLDKNEKEYLYSDIKSVLPDSNISNRQDLISTIDSIGLQSINFIIFIEALVIFLVPNFIDLFIYVFIVALFGHVATGFAKVKFPFKTLIILSIYSVTLPNILYEIYVISNLLTGFYVKYFEIFYMLICCVYIFTAIFMIKSDLIRQQQELQEIVKVQKEVQKEFEDNSEDDSIEKNTEDKKEKPKEDKESEKDENPVIDENKEPDGSEI